MRARRSMRGLWLAAGVTAALVGGGGVASADATTSSFIVADGCVEHQAFVDCDAAAVSARLPNGYTPVLDSQTGRPLLFARADSSLSILLISTGVVTAVPLFWFGYATRHLRLVTVGFLQYLSPIGSFFLGVFLYHEPFTRGHLVTFILIWLALALFTGEAVLRWRSTRVREIDTCAFEASALD